MYEKKIVLLDALVDCQFPLIYCSYVNVLGKSGKVSPKISQSKNCKSSNL